MKYKIERTTKFIKQYAKLVKQKNFKEQEFIKVLKLLVNNEPLPIKYRNHLLEPKSSGIWECHIQPDILLEYKRNKNELILLLISIGSHSDLFKK